MNKIKQILKDWNFIKYCFLFILIFLIHKFVFIKYDIYFVLKWLDIPMHLITSFVVANILIYFYSILELARKHLFFCVFISVVVVGVLWEYYEFVLDMIAHKQWSGYLASLKDMINNITGTLFAFFVYSKKQK